MSNVSNLVKTIQGISARTPAPTAMPSDSNNSADVFPKNLTTVKKN